MPGYVDSDASARVGGRTKGDGATIARLVEQLKSLHESERAALALVASGQQAIPALRQVVFEREPSGLFRARCLAVAALSTLGAQDVLVEFLSISPRPIAGPVERAGEDAVINAAARALAGSRNEAVFRILLRLAAKPSLAGVLEALGEWRRPEAIPWFIEALGDDLGRGAAEGALRKLDALGRRALVSAATAPPDVTDYEHASSLRRRRSAFALLLEIGAPGPDWADLRDLIHDRDIEIALLACRIGLISAPPSETGVIVDRLIDLLGSGDWLLGAEIEDCLVAHIALVGTRVTEALANALPSPDEEPARSRRRQALVRVQARALEHPTAGS